MSEENVEVVRQVYDSLARRDKQAVLALYDPAVEWVISDPPMRHMFAAGVYRGRDGLREFFREWYEAWEDMGHTVEELIDGGNDVVTVVTDRARGELSGAKVARTHAAVWTVRGGKVVRVVWFPTRAEALAAAGLSE